MELNITTLSFPYLNFVIKSIGPSCLLLIFASITPLKIYFVIVYVKCSSYFIPLKFTPKECMSKDVKTKFPLHELPIFQKLLTQIIIFKSTISHQEHSITQIILNLNFSIHKPMRCQKFPFS